MLRVEINHGPGQVDIYGFDQTHAWASSSATSLTQAQARDVRAWLRTRPERLFVKRDILAPYREAGMLYEDHQPGQPWQGPVEFKPPLPLDQVEIIDGISPVAGVNGAGGPIWSDRRRCYYYVNNDNATIACVKWMEPEDPTADADAKVSKVATQVDFANNQRVGGVLWPFDIVHWYGGKVDYRITVAQVQMNQPMAGPMFQHP
jgi:hypothetical protein